MRKKENHGVAGKNFLAAGGAPNCLSDSKELADITAHSAPYDRRWKPPSRVHWPSSSHPAKTRLIGPNWEYIEISIALKCGNHSHYYFTKSTRQLECPTK